MQPNNQQPHPQNTDAYISPSGADIPGYLNMEQAPPVKRTSRKKPIIIIALLLITGLIAGVCYLYIQWMQGEPDRKLFNALGLAMNESYIHREITLKPSRLEDEVSLKVDSDFSNPGIPKSAISYTYGSSGGLITGNLVTLNEEKYAGQVTSPSKGVMDSLKRNKWYEVMRNNASATDPDVFGVYTDTNNPVNAVLMGKYPDLLRNQAQTLLRTSGVYTIQSSESISDKGSSSTKLTVKKDFKKLSQLTKKINTDFGTKLVAPTIDTINTIEITISNQSGKIVKVNEAIKQGDFEVRVDTAYTYPSVISIKVPDDIEPIK